MIIRIGSNSEILAGSRCFPLYPRKRTSGMRAAMSEPAATNGLIDLLTPIADMRCSKREVR